MLISIVITFSAPSPKCPDDWRRYNGSCFRLFNETKTKWKYANALCRSEHGSHLANLNEIKRINASQYIDNGKRYWINEANIKSYSSRDPLEGWRWLNGTQFNDSERRGLYGKLLYTGGKRKCAMIRVSNNGTIWKDSSCLSKQYFICKWLGFGNRSKTGSDNDKSIFIKSNTNIESTVIKPGSNLKSTVIKPGSNVKSTVIKPSTSVKSAVVEPSASVNQDSGGNLKVYHNRMFHAPFIV